MADIGLDSALRRLQRSIDKLESALEIKRENDTSVADMEDELARIGNDRNRLAHDLDLSEARSVRLADANREVSKRLVAAMESIRAVLESNKA